MKRPEDDVPLSMGCGFMVDTLPYKEHLKVAVEIKEVSVVVQRTYAHQHDVLF
jgi:hypothetical protein